MNILPMEIASGFQVKPKKKVRRQIQNTEAMMNVLPFGWEAPIQFAPMIVTPTLDDTMQDDIFECERKRYGSSDSHGEVAWEAPCMAPKFAFLSQSRYERAVPTWELQAPENGFSLAILLKVLELEVDQECVLTVRKIHKLGVASADLLRAHFSLFGEVDRVMLFPSRPKSHGGSGGAVTAKVRPASMAFVVMRSRQPAIVARLNEIHMIDSHPIQVQKFRRDPGHSLEEDIGESTDNYAWLDEASTAADRSPPQMLRNHTSSGTMIN